MKFIEIDTVPDEGEILFPNCCFLGPVQLPLGQGDKKMGFHEKIPTVVPARARLAGNDQFGAKKTAIKRADGGLPTAIKRKNNLWSKMV